MNKVSGCAPFCSSGGQRNADITLFTVAAFDMRSTLKQFCHFGHIGALEKQGEEMTKVLYRRQDAPRWETLSQPDASPAEDAIERLVQWHKQNQQGMHKCHPVQAFVRGFARRVEASCRTDCTALPMRGVSHKFTAEHTMSTLANFCGSLTFLQAPQQSVCPFLCRT